MDEATAQEIIDTKPEEVYRVLSGYDRDLHVDTGNGYNCPLHHYFCDALLMEPDDVKMDMEQVQLGFRGEGEFWTPIPQWMIDYQERITSQPWPFTMGACLDVLREMHPEVLEVDEEEGESEVSKEDRIKEIRACIAELEATYGIDREPMATAVFYLGCFANRLEAEVEGRA
jgi:hypothetical protein